MEDKVRKVMAEFKKKKLKSSNGSKVEDSKQALAIALSEAREDQSVKESAKDKLLKKIKAK